MIRRTVPIEKAWAILKEKNILKPPVPIKRIAVSYGVDLFFVELPDDISGILDLENKNDAKIFVNKLHSSKRQRFSIAHELGHFFLHEHNAIHIDRYSFFRNRNSETALDPMEIEANRFAAEILMPSKFLEEELSRYIDIIDIDEDVIWELAKKFKVTVTAMTIRFQSLGYSF